MTKHLRHQTLECFLVFTSTKYAAHRGISCTCIGFAFCMKVENVTPAELGHGYGNAYPLDVLGRWLEAMTLLKDKLQND